MPRWKERKIKTTTHLDLRDNWILYAEMFLLRGIFFQNDRGKNLDPVGFYHKTNN